MVVEYHFDEGIAFTTGRIRSVTFALIFCRDDWTNLTRAYYYEIPAPDVPKQPAYIIGMWGTNSHTGSYV